MERNNFKERCEVRMAALNLTQDQLGEIVGKPRQRLAEAFRGERAPAASSLRVTIDQTLTHMIDEKRAKMAAEIEERRAVQCPELNGQLSVILPEDMLYIVTEDGIPVGAWNPVSRTFHDLDAAILPVVGKKVK